MKTDPRQACQHTDEEFFWAFVHDCIAHPLMALTFWSRLALRFHDFTSLRAWPRCEHMRAATAFTMQSARFGQVNGLALAGGVFSFAHPTVSHTYATAAGDAVEAFERAEAHFLMLADEFGGAFAPGNNARV